MAAGIRGVGAVLDEVPVTLRAHRRWRTWPMQVAGLWGSHETGTRILLAGLLRLAAVLVGDWVWLTAGEGHGAADAFHEAVRVVTPVGPAADPHGNAPFAVVASTAMLMTIVFTAMCAAGMADRLLGPRPTALIGVRGCPVPGTSWWSGSDRSGCACAGNCARWGYRWSASNATPTPATCSWCGS